MTERRINVTIDGDTASLAVADFRALLGPREQRALETFEARCGVFGGIEHRRFGMEVERAADSGDPDVAFTVKGHAAVFNRKSLDLGGFQEKVAPGFFDEVLDRDPDVHLNWDHDMRLALARTRSSKYLLELRIDPRGLVYYAKVAPTSFASDLRVLMEGGVIDQSSFAFTVADDKWEIVNRDQPNEYVLRTLIRCGELFDVTITAQGAYPQTDSAVVRAYAVAYAQATGRLEAPADDEEPEARAAGSGDEPPEPPAAPAAAAEEEQPEEPVEDEQPVAEERSLGDQQREAREEVAAAKRRYLELERRMSR